MRTADIAVATITWARTPDEGVLLRRSLTRLADFGMPIAVADAGTDAAFTDALRGVRGVRVVVPSQRGLVAQVQASLAEADHFGKRFILYTEPDKYEFFDERLSRFLAAAPDTERTGVVLASRTDRSLATYPAIQQYTEQVASHLCAEGIGVGGDYFYGPFLMARTLGAQAARLDGALGWGWRPAIFLAAHRAGLDVILRSDDHPCPPDQRTDSVDERRHRLRQLSQNVAGLAT